MMRVSYLFTKVAATHWGQINICEDFEASWIKKCLIGASRLRQRRHLRDYHMTIIAVSFRPSEWRRSSSNARHHIAPRLFSCAMKFQLLILAALASLAYSADGDDDGSCKAWSKQFCKDGKVNTVFTLDYKKMIFLFFLSPLGDGCNK